MVSVIASRSLALAASPIRRLRISVASRTAITPSSSPIATVPAPSHLALSVIMATPTATRAMTRPKSAAASSSSTTGNSGAFELRMKDHQLAPLRSGFAAVIAVRSETLSSTIATARIPIAHSGDSSSCG